MLCCDPLFNLLFRRDTGKFDCQMRWARPAFQSNLILAWLRMLGKSFLITSIRAKIVNSNPQIP